jgi:protocatechuate 3,4-dioxygenase beta subunit
VNREAKVIGGVLCAFLIAASCLPVAAQNDKRESQLRTVHGSVLDHSDNPIPSSVVYLKNVRSLAVKTYIADDAGHYRFSGLDPNVDYEIYAQKGNTTSPHRTVSSFDSRKDIEVILRIDTKKNKT